MHTTAHRICPLCEACCGLELRIDRGRVVAVRGHDADVFSAGYLCPKGVALKELHEDADRLRTPMIRRGGRLEPCSWDEAYAEIDRRLPPLIAAHGRDAVALNIGNPGSHKMGLMLYFPRLAKALGSRSLYTASTLDQMPKQLACGLMFGHWLSVPVPDIVRTDLLVVIGANPAVSNGSLWTVPDFRGKAKALRARGGRMIVIDPRRTETAELADRHLSIRPGGDAFLLLGIVHTLFEEGLTRLGRVAPHVAGVEALREAVGGFAAEAVSERCGIEAADIRSLARILAETPRAAVYGRLGTCTQAYGTLASWLVDVVNTLTGHLDEPGGAMFPKAAAFAANTAGAPGRGRGVITGRHASRVSGAPEVFGELPITCLAEEIETPGPGQVRALITIAGNPVLSAPNGSRLAKALDSLDFMLSLDIYLNETTRHADVILPGLSPLEEGHYDVPYPQFSWRNHARYSGPVFPPPAGQPAEWESLLTLAAIVEGEGPRRDTRALDDAWLEADLQRMVGAQAPLLREQLDTWHGPERLLDLALRTGPCGDGFGRGIGGGPERLTLAMLREHPEGIDLGELAPRIPEMLRTPSGRIELAPAALLDDLRRAAAGLATPAEPLVVIGRRDVRSNNSWMHNLPLLAKGPFRCTALMNPDDARQRGLADGSRARISQGERSIDVQVALSDAMRPGVVSLPHGWGHDGAGTQLRVAAERPGANLNAVLDDGARDPLSGNAVLSGVPIRMEALP